MRDELVFQSELVKDARALGGYGIKLNNKFKVGVPDLLLKVPGVPSALVECKRIKQWPKKTNSPVTLDLTPIQERSLREYALAGGLSLIAIDLPNQPGMRNMVMLRVFPDPITLPLKLSPHALGLLQLQRPVAQIWDLPTIMSLAKAVSSTTPESHDLIS